MINHVRTLLHNMPPAAESDEYVPEDFVPVEAPEIVQKVKRLLWGRTPSSQVRLRQIMQMLHATELEKYVVAKDLRITYLPFDDKYLGTDVGDLASCLPTLQTLVSADDERILFMLADGANNEPFKTWYELWKKDDRVPYKLGGLLLAVADCTERART